MYLRAVGDMLSSASTEMFQAAASRVLPVLELPGITRGNNLLQDEVVPLRLKNTLLRILTAEGSRYKPHIEELQRVKAAQSGHRSPTPSHTQSSSSGTGFSWLDRFGDKMESLASDLESSVTKLSYKVPLALGAEPSLASVSAGSSSHGHGPSGSRLLERVVAAEAMVAVSQELAASRSALLAALHAAAKVVAAQPGLLLPPSALPAVAATGAYTSGGRPSVQGSSSAGSGGGAGGGPVTPSPSTPMSLATSSMSFTGAGHSGSFEAGVSAGGGGGGTGPRLQYEGMQQVLQAGGAVGSSGVGLGHQASGMAPTTEHLGKEADQYFKRSVEAGRDVQQALVR
ncbi:predicted protein, partial [Haematococcus lacustris]